jgi:hypothetical protein
MIGFAPLRIFDGFHSARRILRTETLELQHRLQPRHWLGRFLIPQRFMWVAAIATSIRLANIGYECLGVLKLHLERRK